jgi:hypothetical protein
MLNLEQIVNSAARFFKGKILCNAKLYGHTTEQKYSKSTIT